MEIQSTKDQQNNVHSASIVTVLTPNETKFVQTYGEPQIDLGGTIPFTDHLSSGSTFTLPNKLAGIRNGIPYVQQFSSSGDLDAKQKRDGWIAEIITRLTAAKSTLMGLPQPTTPNTATATV